MKRNPLKSLSFVLLVTLSTLSISNVVIVHDANAAPQKKSAKEAKPASTPATASSAPTKSNTPSASPISKTAPIRVAYINAIDGDGDKAYATIDKVFKNIKNVMRIEKDVADQTARAYNLKNENFKDDQSRASHSKDINNMLSDLRADLLIVVDVTNKGNNLEVIAVDTKGKQIHSESKKIRKGKISSRDAKKLLDATIDAARPSVEQFRKNGGWKQQAPPVAAVPPPSAEEIAAQDPAAAALGIKQDGTPITPATTPSAALKSKEVASGSEFLAPVSMFTATALGTFGISDIKLSNSQKENVNYGAKYPGAALMLDTTFTFGKRIGLGFSLFGGYSMYNTDLYVYKDPNDPSKGITLNGKIPSNLIFAQAQINIPIAVTNKLMISPFVGGDFRLLEVKNTSSQKIDFNGDKFIGARAGLMLNVVVSNFRADLGGGVIPSFVNKVSNDIYGQPKSKIMLSYEGRAVLGYEVIPHLAIVAGYNFRLSTAKMSKAGSIFATSNQPPKLSDMSHLAFGGIQYRL